MACKRVSGNLWYHMDLCSQSWTKQVSAAMLVLWSTQGFRLHGHRHTHGTVTHDSSRAWIGPARGPNGSTRYPASTGCLSGASSTFGGEVKGGGGPPGPVAPVHGALPVRVLIWQRRK